jgi:hypothetical protein
MRSDEPLYMVFMDLKKAYDTLDRTQVLRILKEYGVGEKLLRIISTIWANDTMVPRQSGYFGRAFRRAHRGVRQGDIMSPVIFNVMVDAVVRHWRATDSTGFDLETLLFYADDGLLAGTDAQQVQESLDVITKGFLSVGLKMNATKTEYMSMEGGKRVVRLSNEAYERQCTGRGKTHRETSSEKVTCELCGTKVVDRQYLPVHQTRATCKDGRKEYVPPPPEWIAAAVQAEPPERGARTYRMSIPRGHTGEVVCPVDGCVASMLQQTLCMSLQKHFRLRHLEDTIIIEEEGLLPRCNLCGFFSKIASHPETSGNECGKFAEKRHQHFQQKRQEMAREVSFNVNGEKIYKVSEFTYLGRILEETDDDEHAANRQLTRARARWRRIAKILTIDGASPRVMGYFYKAIIQTELLYGSESWTLTGRMIGKLRSFHHRVARYITGRHIKELEDGTYFCPSMKDVLKRQRVWRR